MGNGCRDFFFFLCIGVFHLLMDALSKLKVDAIILLSVDTIFILTTPPPSTYTGITFNTLR